MRIKIETVRSDVFFTIIANEKCILLFKTLRRCARAKSLAHSLPIRLTLQIRVSFLLIA